MHTQTNKNRIELLAPAGNREALHAAVENGADAVYLGGKLFSARQLADNFDIGILKEELYYAHTRGASIYLTMNTLISDDEMKQALSFAAEARDAGVDGFIVQDIGLAGALRRIMPDVPLHGSTQMTVCDLDGVRMLEEMGFQRVVLARELSLGEASEIARNTRLEVEVFVHGALCVCYSGQCLMSSMIGGRSGNRGKCAQPCRLPYRLSGPYSGKSGTSARTEAPGSEKIPRYLMSPKDMCSLEHIHEIVSSGIHSLKIEGRMKSPEYVSTVVRIYRKYIDLAVENNGGKSEIDQADMHDLLQIYNRGGFSSGYLKGRTGADMMSYDKPNNSGICLGSVIAYDSRSQTMTIRLDDTLSIGDGIEIWMGSSDSPGGTVTFIKKGRQNLKTARKGDLAEIGYFRGRITAGSRVYKTTDTELNRAARESFSVRGLRRINISGSAALRAGQPLALSVADKDGHTVSAVGTLLPEKAINRPLTEERLREQLYKTGSTPFDFSDLRIETEEGLAIPVSEINEVRRQALDRLLALRADRYAGLRNDSHAGFKTGQCSELNTDVNARIEETIDSMDITVARKRIEAIRLSLYFYRWDQSIDYSALGADRVYLPFSSMDRPGFGTAARALRDAGAEVYGWIPAITRGNYDKIIEKANIDENCVFDGILAGNIGTVRKFREMDKESYLSLAGDVSMNLFNTLSVREAAEMGLKSAALSSELTMQQIVSISKPQGLDIEAAVYGRLPLMISEYCPVGCTEGGLRTTVKCSGCCSRGSYVLQDRKSINFPVVCDRIDCRSTILNSSVLFIPDSVHSLAKAGVDILRLYILDEEPELISELIKLYRSSASGDKGETAAYGRLSESIKASGFTKGHYYRGV